MPKLPHKTKIVDVGKRVQCQCSCGKASRVASIALVARNWERDHLKENAHG